MLARTNPEARKPQEGISFILVDMKTPGITVRPIQLVDGGHEVNEVFLRRCAGAGGKPGGHGASRLGLREIPAGQRAVEYRARRARRKRGCGGCANWRRRCRWATARCGRASRSATRCSAVETELKALEMTQLRVIAAEQNNGGMPNPASSILKIKGSEIQQRTTELALELAGPFALPYHMTRTTSRRRVRTICPRVSAGRIRRRRRISIIAR